MKFYVLYCAIPQANRQLCWLPRMHAKRVVSPEPIPRTCAGAPAAATCSVPATLPLSVTASSFNVSVSTTARSLAFFSPAGRTPWLLPLALLACLALLLKAATAKQCVGKVLQFVPLMAIALCPCSGGSTSPAESKRHFGWELHPDHNCQIWNHHANPTPAPHSAAAVRRNESGGNQSRELQPQIRSVTGDSRGRSFATRLLRSVSGKV